MQAVWKRNYPFCWILSRNHTKNSIKGGTFFRTPCMHFIRIFTFSKIYFLPLQ